VRVIGEGKKLVWHFISTCAASFVSSLTELRFADYAVFGTGLLSVEQFSLTMVGRALSFVTLNSKLIHFLFVVRIVPEYA